MLYKDYILIATWKKLYKLNAPFLNLARISLPARFQALEVLSTSADASQLIQEQSRTGLFLLQPVLLCTPYCIAELVRVGYFSQVKIPSSFARDITQLFRYSMFTNFFVNHLKTNIDAHFERAAQAVTANVFKFITLP